jgi:NADPH:quinone reductase-like Zn-dependent oxidoreductase
VKAIVQDEYGTADVLELRDIEQPAPAADELLVHVRAAGVDPGVWHLMTGRPYLVRMMGLGVRRPKQPVRGWAFAGTVEAVGDTATELQPGDEVYGVARGSFAEYSAADLGEIARKPANLGFDEAAAVPISGETALQALRDRGEIESGDRVLVIGASGGVGTYAVQLAKAFGAEVTGVASTTKLDLVRSIGADHVVDYLQEDFTDGRQRYDLIVDTGGRRPLSELRRALAPDGTLVIVGGEGGGKWTGGFGRQMFRAPLLSLFVGQKLRPLTAKTTTEDLAALTELIEAGKVKPVIDRTYALDEAPDAVRYLESGQARGKVVVTVSDS